MFIPIPYAVKLLCNDDLQHTVDPVLSIYPREIKIGFWHFIQVLYNRGGLIDRCDGHDHCKSKSTQDLKKKNGETKTTRRNRGPAIIDTPSLDTPSLRQSNCISIQVEDRAWFVRLYGEIIHELKLVVYRLYRRTNLSLSYL